MYNLLIVLALALFGGTAPTVTGTLEQSGAKPIAVSFGGNATPVVNQTGKVLESGVWKSFTVSSVNSGASTFAVTWSGGGRSGIPFAKFHEWPTAAFIIGDDGLPLATPAVDDEAILYKDGEEYRVTVIRVDSGNSQFDVVVDGTTDELADIPFSSFGETPASADFIVIDDIIN